MTQNSQNLTKKYFEDLTKKTLCRSQKILGKLAKHQVQLKPDLLKSAMLCNPETPKKGSKMLTDIKECYSFCFHHYKNMYSNRSRQSHPQHLEFLSLMHCKKKRRNTTSCPQSGSSSSSKSSNFSILLTISTMQI